MPGELVHRVSIALSALRYQSLGLLVVGGLFIASLVAVAVDRPSEDQGEHVEMWVFSPEHRAMYQPIADASLAAEATSLDVQLMSIAAIKSRMMSGFFGGLPTADLIEVERSTIGQVFMGPADAIGFVDLTDRLEAEGLLDGFNPPSLSPWSTEGRVFGLPHDVHPVLLAYRADVTEAAGIDLAAAETWEQFFEMLRPLRRDADGDGRIDHYPLSMWYTREDNLEVLLLQGDGRLFDDAGVPTLHAPRNAELLARIVSWSLPDDQRIIDIEEFTAAGHQSRVEAEAIAYLAPDWMCSIWRMHVPGIAGKMKLMPLPAFEPGGRRTSVRGGTMLGIPKTTERFEESWAYALELYTSPEVARELYRQVDIITPVVSLWDDPVFDEPDPFFMGQAKGRMYIEMAPRIPPRSSSPYNRPAVFELRDAATNLAQWAQREGVRSNELGRLRERASALLERAQENIVRQMRRNAFAPVPGQAS